MPESVVHVVAAVITRGDTYLLCRRPAHKRHPNLWEFPGGKLEEGEDHGQAARRELEEELGVGMTTAGPVLKSFRDPGSVFVIDFVPVEIQGEPEPREHSEIGWYALGEMGALELAPSDTRFVDFLKEG